MQAGSAEVSACAYVLPRAGKKYGFVGAIAGGYLLSFQCCLRANGVILKEDGVRPPRLKHHFNFPKSVTSAEW